MFSDNKLTRIFILSVLVAVSLPLLNILLIYPKFNAVLISNMEDVAVRLATHVQGSLGESWEALVRGEADGLTEEFPVLIKDFGLLKMKIFSADGNTVYSTEVKDVGVLNTKTYFHNQVASGNIFSKVVKKRSSSLEGQRFEVDVVEIYVPVMRNDSFAGAFELYYDITAPVGALNRTIWYSSILPFTVSTALVLLMLALLKSLDRNIAEKQKIESELSESLNS